MPSNRQNAYEALHIADSARDDALRAGAPVDRDRANDEAGYQLARAQVLAILAIADAVADVAKARSK